MKTDGSEGVSFFFLVGDDVSAVCTPAVSAVCSVERPSFFFGARASAGVFVGTPLPPSGLCSQRFTLPHPFSFFFHHSSHLLYLVSPPHEGGVTRLWTVRYLAECTAGRGLFSYVWML